MVRGVQKPVGKRLEELLLSEGFAGRQIAAQKEIILILPRQGQPVGGGRPRDEGKPRTGA